MRFFNAHKFNGFTQIEIAITVIVIGILSALALPSFLGWYGTKQVEEALTELRSLLQEAQVNAIRGSITCPISITAGSNPSISSPQAKCLSAGVTTLDGLSLRRSSGLSSLSYNFLGETNLTSSVETVVLANDNNGGKQKCLVIAGPIGLIRIGTYLASDTTGTDPNNCSSPQ